MYGMDAAFAPADSTVGYGRVELGDRDRDPASYNKCKFTFLNGLIIGLLFSRGSRLPACWIFLGKELRIIYA